ncbi:family A G protein-coupled receptor-like protein [Hyaloscypha hepaticicola]|uniref:Family A G protein-coupled receptor-like protein n=1 Tax=Hyaloscypha hepaticicola TaxID=2082293 RepID=A0A2J6PZ32_9HELO|nr:family A G protein-coupled receptor-like protein [Hyaloscypha hepaticicola]
MAFLPPSNDVLSINPPNGVDIALSVQGSDWLWAVTAVYIVAFFGCLVPSFTSHESKRVFNYMLAMCLLAGAASYYAQASDLGWSTVEQGNHHSRQIFYARYINWAISFPTLALSLGLLSGISWTTIVLNIFMAWLWVLNYLAAAYTTTIYKWGFFAFGTLAYIFLTMSTINESRESAEVLGIGLDYIILSGWVNLLWLLYPIAFGLSDGGHVIGVTGGFIFFGILDVLLLPVVSIGFLILSRKWDFSKLQLDFSEYRAEIRSASPENAGP